MTSAGPSLWSLVWLLSQNENSQIRASRKSWDLALTLCQKRGVFGQTQCPWPALLMPRRSGLSPALFCSSHFCPVLYVDASVTLKSPLLICHGPQPRRDKRRSQMNVWSLRGRATLKALSMRLRMSPLLWWKYHCAKHYY